MPPVLVILANSRAGELSADKVQLCQLSTIANAGITL